VTGLLIYLPIGLTVTSFCRHCEWRKSRTLWSMTYAKRRVILSQNSRKSRWVPF